MGPVPGKFEKNPSNPCSVRGVSYTRVTNSLVSSLSEMFPVSVDRPSLDFRRSPINHEQAAIVLSNAFRCSGVI